MKRLIVLGLLIPAMAWGQSTSIIVKKPSGATVQVPGATSGELKVAGSGIAGAPAPDVITIQGITGGKPLPTIFSDSNGNAVSPQPLGQATMAASLPVVPASDWAGNTNISAIATNTANIPAKGQAAMASATPVTLASDQPPIATATRQPSSSTAWVCNISVAATAVTASCPSPAAAGQYIHITTLLAGVSGAGGVVQISQSAASGCTSPTVLWGPFSLNQNAGIPLTSSLPILDTTNTAQYLCVTITGTGSTGNIYLKGYTTAVAN